MKKIVVYLIFLSIPGCYSIVELDSRDMLSPSFEESSVMIYKKNGEVINSERYCHTVNTKKSNYLIGSGFDNPDLTSEFEGIIPLFEIDSCYLSKSSLYVRMKNLKELTFVSGDFMIIKDDMEKGLWVNRSKGPELIVLNEIESVQTEKTDIPSTAISLILTAAIIWGFVELLSIESWNFSP